MFQSSLLKYCIKILVRCFLLLSPFLIYKFMPLQYKLECKLFFLNSVYRFFNTPPEHIMGFIILFTVFLLFIIGGDDNDEFKKK
jgi:hypothetical protein